MNQEIRDEIEKEGWEIFDCKKNTCSVKKEKQDGFLKFQTNKKNDLKKEIDILVNPKFKGQVLNLLEYNYTASYFITEKGVDFEKYWREKTQALKPEHKEKEAIETIIKISEQLKVFHDNGIVHLDIKPKNLISINGEIKIIDFATYAEIGERIKGSRGNRGFSPQASMYKNETVREWFDIFNLNQLLIWMLDNSNKKYWERPMDWRYARYDILNDEYIRAITAVCSDEQISPQNIDNFIGLLNNYYNTKMSNNPNKKIDFESIKKGENNGLAIQAIKKGEDGLLVSASIEQSKIFFNELLKELRSIECELKKKNINFRVEESSIDFLINESYPYKINFQGNCDSFNVRVGTCLFFPSLKDILPIQIPEGYNLITFCIQVYANLGHGRFKFPSEIKRILFRKDGQLMLSDEKFECLKETNINEIKDIIVEWITKEERWELINRDR